MASSLVVLLAAAITWAAWLCTDWTRPDEWLESAASPGSGIVVSGEALHLWLPETLGELASPEAPRQLLRDHDGFRRFLEHRRQEAFRYAVTYRGHQVNGGWSDITFVRRPYDEPRHFQEFADVLAGAGGEPDREVANLRGTLVHIIPDELLNREPSAMLAELQRIVE